MKVLILTQWYHPEPEILMRQLARTLRDYGHDVAVLTGFPNYPSGEIYPGYSLHIYQRELLDSVPIVRVPLYPEHSHSGVRRILNYVSFALSSALLGPWLLKKPDVIFVYHPPLTIGLPAFVLSRLWKIPFVYQIQDMWPETLRATGMLQNPILLRWIGRFAKWVYTKSKTILVISPGFQRNLLEKGVPLGKIRVISNWIDAKAFGSRDLDENLSNKLALSDRFNIVYAGNMGEAQGLDNVLEAASLLSDNPAIQFVFVGEGIALESLKKIVKDKNIDNVRFLGRYPYHAMPSLYALADVLLVHLKDDPLFSITIPSKTLAYMASGKPILAAVSGDMADLITRVGAGISCQPGNARILADSVRQLFRMSAVDRRAMGERGRHAAENQYSSEVLIPKIERELKIAASTEN